MYHSNREDPSNHRCVLYDSRSPGHFSAAAVISPSEKRQAENLTPLHHQSFHFTNDAAAQLATRSMEPCYTRPNDIVRAQQLSINLPWPAGAESAAKPHDHRNNKEHGIARICRGECTPAPLLGQRQFARVFAFTPINFAASSLENASGRTDSTAHVTPFAPPIKTLRLSDHTHPLQIETI